MSSKGWTLRQGHPGKAAGLPSGRERSKGDGDHIPGLRERFQCAGEDVLSGRFGDKPDDVNPYAASSFYAVDRYASYKTRWGSFYEAGGIVIADRYTTSNAVHQCSKLPPEQWDDFLRWAFDYEYRLLGLPAPDDVVYLQVDPAVSQKLMTGRYHGDESRKDVHEKDIESSGPQPPCRRVLCGASGWATVHCTENGAMRTIEEIQAEVRALAEKELG